MANDSWMIYGAYGYTGELIVEEALRRDHRPLLAGRSATKLKRVAGRFGLPSICVDLNDTRALTQAVAGVDLVLHAAGPFMFTAERMLRACLTAGTHYADITGEIRVFQTTFGYDALAKRRGVTLLSGAGFDVVPTDCLASYVAARLPEADSLELAFATFGGASPGTLKTALEAAPGGGQARRAGKLVAQPQSQGIKRVRFPDGERSVLPIPWGDLETAYRSTGIPNITTYMAVPGTRRATAPAVLALGQRLLGIPALRSILKRGVTTFVQGPDRRTRETGRTYCWARASSSDAHREAWLEGLEAYRFTAVAAVRCVEHILAEHPAGALTPSQAFGPDFVLEIEGTRRYDTLPTGRDNIAAPDTEATKRHRGMRTP